MVAIVPPLLLSGVWTIQKPKGYWMAEKFDGVRCYWDGSRLLSRNGNEFTAPDWFLAQLPVGLALDGELWMGRGEYLAAMGAVKRIIPNEIEWSAMRFMVFDLPHHSGTFEERQAALADVPMGVNMQRVVHVTCEGKRHMVATLRAIHAQGGEGLMLREAGSRYVPERSRTLLKVRCANNSELL